MFISIALRGYGPVTVACARTTMGALTMLAIMKATRRKLPRSWAIWRYAAPAGLLYTAIPFFLYSWAQTRVSSAFAGLSLSVVPLFVLPLAHFFANERLTTRKFLGFILGFCGVLIILLPGAFDGALAPLHRLGCILATLCYAVSSILLRRCPAVDPISLSAGALTTGAVTLIPIMLISEGVPHWGGGRPTAALLFLGFIATALAMTMRVVVIRRAGASFLTLVSFQVPLWSMFFGTVVLNEQLSSAFLPALALILVGLLVSQSRSIKTAQA